MQKVFMTAKEVQDFLDVSKTTAYQLISVIKFTPLKVTIKILLYL